MVTVESISGVTLYVTDMTRSVTFYSDILGLKVLYGGKDARFTSFGIGNKAYLNLELSESSVKPWGRIILYCDDVDEMYQVLSSNGYHPSQPRDASWGERYFHIRDPDGHELSIAKPLII